MHDVVCRVFQGVEREVHAPKTLDALNAADRADE